MKRRPEGKGKFEKGGKGRTVRLDELNSNLTEDIAEPKQVKEAIVKSDQKWVQIFNAVSDLVMILDDQHRILQVNKATADAFGITEQEAIGQICFELVHGTKECPDYCPHACFLADGKEHVAEIFEPRLGGTYDVRVFPLLDQDGQRSRSVHIARNITEKKRTEEEVRQQSQFLSNILDSLTHQFYVIDANDYTIAVANRAAESSGITVGQKCYTATHMKTSPCSDPDHSCPLLEVKKTAKAQSVQHIHYDDGGSPRYVEIHAYPIIADGEVTQIIEYALDVTDRKKAEEALLRSEKKYRSLFDESRDGVYGVLRDGEITDANASFCEIFGYNREELIGRNIRELYVDPSERHAFQKEIEKIGFVKDYEIRFLKKDRTEVDCLLTTSIQFGDDGGIIGYRGIIRDVTHLKQAEQALRESEARYRELFENSSDIIYTHDLGGNYTSVNEAAKKILGYSKEEFLGLNFRDIVDPEYLPTTEGHFRRKAIDGLEKTSPYELIVRSKDETPLWFEVTSRLIKENGTPVGIHGTGRDVTERKAAQEALRESESRMRLLIEESPIGIAITKNGRRVYANPALARIFGYQIPDEMLGKPVTDFYEPESRELVREAQEHVLQGTSLVSQELKARDAHGKQIHLRVWPRKIDYLGGPAILSFIADTSRERSLASQLLQAQKMEAIGNLAGGLAHDFNNLLQVIQGYCELLLFDEDMSGRARSRLEDIKHTVRSGADLVRRLLTFSRKNEIKPRPMDVNHEVVQIKSLLERSIPKKIHLELNLADGLSPVNADPTQIEQVLVNLAVNARDAMPDGGKLAIETKNVLLHEEYCRLHLEAEPGDYVLVSISDTGHGMDKETLKHIFEPFYTTKEADQGTGLGLAVVHGIVKHHGGYITCYSEVGEGTTFKIYFPAILSEANRIPQDRHQCFREVRKPFCWWMIKRLYGN